MHCTLKHKLRWEEFFDSPESSTVLLLQISFVLFLKFIIDSSFMFCVALYLLHKLTTKKHQFTRLLDGSIYVLITLHSV